MDCYEEEIFGPVMNAVQFYKSYMRGTADELRAKWELVLVSSSQVFKLSSKSVLTNNYSKSVRLRGPSDETEKLDYNQLFLFRVTPAHTALK